MSETDKHYRLKWKALEWLYNFKKCKYVALEVKIGKYIFDALGCDGTRVYIVEAKQDKKDYIKDCNDPISISENIKIYKELLRETGDKKKYIKLIKKERSKNIKFNDKALLKLSSFRYIITDLTLDNVTEDWGVITSNFGIIKKCNGNKIEHKYSQKVIMDICNKHTKYYLEDKGVQFGKMIEFPKVNE